MSQFKPIFGAMRQLIVDEFVIVVVFVSALQ